MNNPLVSIIIVNWNGRKYLDNCLGSLSKIDYKNVEIFFVDNASSDDSVAYVKKNYPHFILIVNKKNLGFAEGHEEAFRKSKGSAVLLLSMDTIVEKNFLSEMVKILFSKKDNGAVQPKLLMFPKRNLIDSIGSFFLMNGNLYHFGREKDSRLARYNKLMEIFSAKGACLLFKKETLQKTRLFDKDYFAYFEETDLCMRIWLAGYRIMYAPKATVYHTGGGSSGQMPSSFILFHSYKNGICTYIKNLSIKYLILVIPRMIFLYQVAFIGYILQANFAAAWAIQKAIVWNIVHIRKNLKKRKIIQNKVRTVSDNTFLPKLTKKVSHSYYYYQFFGGMEKYTDVS